MRVGGLNSVMWVDDIFIWGTDFDDLLHTLDAKLGRLERVSLYAAAHKCMLYDTSIQRFGIVYSGGVVRHDLERVSGMADVYRPDNAGDLMQGLQALNRMQAMLPRVVEVVRPPREC